MHIFVTDILSALGYGPPVHRLERRWTMGELRENPADTAPARREADHQETGWKQGDTGHSMYPSPLWSVSLAFGSHRRPPHPPTARQRWRQAQSPWREQSNMLDKVALRVVVIEQEKSITGL